jgi:hypothetical protein
MGQEPYYYYSENSAWYDSYGRLRYGPRGIPADEYRKSREPRYSRDQDSSAPLAESPSRSSNYNPGSGSVAAPPQRKYKWPNNPLGISVKEGHKGLLDWH